MTGSITSLVIDRGFGFIGYGDVEYFFHRSAVTGVAFEDLRVGSLVTFEEEQSRKGPRAKRVWVA